MKIRGRVIVGSGCALALAMVVVFVTFRLAPSVKEPVADGLGPRLPAGSFGTRTEASRKPAKAPPPATAVDVVSPHDLIGLIRTFAANRGDVNALYREILSLRPQQQSWWRGSGDFSEMLDLAFDRSIDEEYRVAAMTVYLGAASQTQIIDNADKIQQFAANAGEGMASAVLQGMADRSVAPSALTKHTLTSKSRGTGAKCHAWNAGRLTQKNDAVLAEIALTAADTGMTEASKVAFDYLASGSYVQLYSVAPGFQQRTDTLLGTVQSLPADTGPMNLANGDAFIRAVPSIMPTPTAVQSLIFLLHEARNPEMRLSAIEKLVSIHISGAHDLSQELHEVREKIATLFPDPVKQDRAKIRLARIDAQRSSK